MYFKFIITKAFSKCVVRSYPLAESFSINLAIFWFRKLNTFRSVQYIKQISDMVHTGGEQPLTHAWYISTLTRI